RRHVVCHHSRQRRSRQSGRSAEHPLGVAANRSQCVHAQRHVGAHPPLLHHRRRRRSALHRKHLPRRQARRRRRSERQRAPAIWRRQRVRRHARRSPSVGHGAASTARTVMTTVFRRVGVGPYEIGHEIGRGGMAVVFVATDSRDGRCVALKLVPAATDRDAQEVLEAERWGAKLQEQFCRISQNVPVVYEHGTEGGYFYIAMEYIDGQNLSEILTAGALALPRAVNIAIQLCHFLEAAHGFESTIDGRNLHSLLHGDLKPRNIRVLRTDKVKVLDFGIAKALSLSRRVTRNNFGSMTYVSPERLETGEIDAYADYWAIGVLLYEMLSGVQPFRAPDTRRLELRIRSQRPPEPLGASCPPALRAVVAKLLARRPADRYGDGRAIREDLERVLSGRTAQAEREGWPVDRNQHDEPPTACTRPPVHVDEDATRRTPQVDAKPGVAALSPTHGILRAAELPPTVTPHRSVSRLVPV